MLIPAYSIAKPFLAQAVLELGLDLEDSVGTFLTGLEDVYAKRKIADLLNHTAGLNDYSAIPEYFKAVER